MRRQPAKLPRLQISFGVKYTPPMAHQFLAELEEIYTGAQAGAVDRWSAVDFFDKVIFGQSSVFPLYWPGGGKARPLPGLPSTEQAYDGVEVLAGHIVLWRGELIKWGDLNDYTTFIPVSQTAVSLRAITLNFFTQPASGDLTDWIHLDETNTSFVVGQFVRVDLNEDDPTTVTTSFYTVEEIASPVGVNGTSIGVAQTVAAGATGKIFTNAYIPWNVGSWIVVGGVAKHVEVTASSRDLTGTFTSSTISAVVPAAGGSMTITVNENPSSLKVGDVLSLGNIATTGLDLYEVESVGFTIQLSRLNVGTKKQAPGYQFPVGTFLTFQPFATVKNNETTTLTVASLADIRAQGSVRLKRADLTGELVTGATIPEGASVASVDANEAGETVNAGSSTNGRIFSIVSLGDYGVILKERSIQSMQYVGLQSGTFYIRPEILDEGPISKNAWRRYGDKKIVFLGHKHLYEYAGGQTLMPIADQHINEVYRELDRSRADEIVIYHNESANEMWLVYPTLADDSLKVLIYNYQFNSCVIDSYSTALGGITALGGVDWELAPTWNDLLESQIWSTETLKWYQYVEEGQQRYTIIATGGDAAIPAIGEVPGTTVPRLLLHGRKFSRCSGDNCAEAAYTAIAETQDFDFGDGANWKYADTLQLDLEVKQHLTRPMFLFVQLGARNNLDSDIRWSSPSKVEVSGNGTIVTKVNIRMAGRYLRIRFYSQTVGAQWRIAGWRLMARRGGSY
jgi:hypothetical protein